MARWIGIVASAGLLALGACATPTERVASRCAATDWAALGAQDGEAGFPEARRRTLFEECRSVGVPPDIGQYRANRAGALAEYCTAENGYEVGRSGELYYQVCEGEAEAAFLEGLTAGREALAAAGGPQPEPRYRGPSFTYGTYYGPYYRPYYHGFFGPRYYGPSVVFRFGSKAHYGKHHGAHYGHGHKGHHGGHAKTGHGGGHAKMGHGGGHAKTGHGGGHPPKGKGAGGHQTVRHTGEVQRATGLSLEKWSSGRTRKAKAGRRLSARERPECGLPERLRQSRQQGRRRLSAGRSGRRGG